MSGTAIDDRASSGSGISDIQVFLGSRDAGGLLLGSTTPVATGTLGAWSVATNFPDSINGGQNLFVYGTSAVSGEQAIVMIPIAIGQLPTGETVSDQSASVCPAMMQPTAAPTSAPTVQLASPTIAPTAQPVAAAPQPTAQPAPTTPPASVPAPAPAATQVQLSISSPASPPISYDVDMLSAASGADVTVTFTNNTPGVPHSWHVFDGTDSNAPTLAQTQIITGPGTSDSVSFTAPTQAGNYFFWCDVHTSLMQGTFVVTEGS